MQRKLLGMFTAIAAALLLVGVAWASGDQARDDSSSGTVAGTPGSDDMTSVTVADTVTSVTSDDNSGTTNTTLDDDDGTTNTTLDDDDSTTTTTLDDDDSTTHHPRRRSKHPTTPPSTTTTAPPTPPSTTTAAIEMADPTTAQATTTATTIATTAEAKKTTPDAKGHTSARGSKADSNDRPTRDGRSSMRTQWGPIRLCRSPRCRSRVGSRVAEVLATRTLREGERRERLLPRIDGLEMEAWVRDILKSGRVGLACGA
jgi:hypothetical protein